MTGGLKQVAAALRHRGLAFSFLIAQVAFGMVVVSQALVLAQVFRGQPPRASLDKQGPFAITSEADDLSVADRDLAALRGLPGVRAVGWSARAFFLPRTASETLSAAGREAPAWDVFGTGALSDALGFQLIEGRALVDGDAADPERPALVSAALARLLFPGQGAVGQVITARVLGISYRVAGVFREGTIESPIAPGVDNVIVRAVRPPPGRHNEYVVRVDAEARAGFPDAASAALRAISADRFLRIETLAQRADRWTDTRIGVLITLLVVVVLVLGIVLLGAMGMATLLVAERRREIGIRRALGATRGDIGWYFVFENFAMVSAGLALGTAASFALDRFLVHRVFPFAVLELHHIGQGAILFWATGLLAAAIPAVRASRVLPAVASRAV